MGRTGSSTLEMVMVSSTLKSDFFSTTSSIPESLAVEGEGVLDDVVAVAVELASNIGVSVDVAVDGNDAEAGASAKCFTAGGREGG